MRFDRAPGAVPAQHTQQRLASGFGLQDPMASSYKSDQHRGSIDFMKGNARSSHGAERKNPRPPFRRPDHDQRPGPGDQSEFWNRRSSEKRPQNGSEQRSSGEEQQSDEMTFFGSSRQNIPAGVSDPVTGSSQSRFKSTAPDDLNSYSSSASEVEIDDFFAGFATTKKVDPKIRAEHDKIVQPQSRAPAELASWTVPNESGVRLVRKILEDRGGVARLREIWDEGTKDCIPVLAPTMVIEPNGKIRMKRTATMREGRRAYVPPAGAKFPDHPFRSMR